VISVGGSDLGVARLRGTATTPGTVSDSASAASTNVNADADDSGSTSTTVIGA